MPLDLLWLMGERQGWSAFHFDVMRKENDLSYCFIAFIQAIEHPPRLFYAAFFGRRRAGSSGTAAVRKPSQGSRESAASRVGMVSTVK